MSTAVYVRLSRDAGHTRLAVTRQRDDCEQLCAANGWAPITLYEDNDISAYSGKRRPAYEQMLDDMKTGTVERVVAWHPDRLHRSLVELERFIQVVDASGCSVTTVTAGSYDLSTVEGRMTARIIGSVARAESEHKSRRIRRKHLELAEHGQLSGGGTRPYGYSPSPGVDGKQTFAVVPDEAAVIVEMMSRYLAGESLTGLCRELNARAVPTSAGGTWRTSTLRGILTSGLISAQREHRGRIVAAGSWPAIVTPEQTDHARAVAAFHAASSTRTRDTYLLSGLVRCLRCGASMHAGETVGGVPKLRCRRPPGGCGRTVIIRADVCDLVEAALLQAMNDVDLASRRPDGGSHREASTEISDSEAQLTELAAAYADRVVSLAEWRVARDRIQERINAAQQHVGATVTGTAALLPYAGRPEALRKAWPHLEISQRRSIAAAIIDHVTIAPALHGRNWFDPDRVNINWRG